MTTLFTLTLDTCFRSHSLRITAVLVLLLFTQTAQTAHAQVPDAIWRAFMDRDIVVEGVRVPGSGAPVVGRLISIEENGVVILTADGTPILVSRKDVTGVRVAIDRSAETPRVRARSRGRNTRQTELAPTSEADRAGLDNAPVRRKRHRGYYGLSYRMLTCVAGCNTTVHTLGPEFGYTFIGLGVHFGTQDGTTYIIPNLRFYGEIAAGPYVTITPAFELSPMLAFNSGATALAPMLRTTLRLGFNVTPKFVLFVEPLGFDISNPVVAWYEGQTFHENHTAVRYASSLGLQGRW